jgi:membrane fusion protein (multidrug efflux system)
LGLLYKAYLMHFFYRTFREYLTIIALNITVCLMACDSKPKVPEARPNPPTVVDVIIAAPKAVNRNIEVNGTVVANEFVELRPEVSGRLTYLNVPEGNRIAQGTVLARVNDADLKAQYSKIQVQLDLAQKTEERYRQLLAVNGINQSDYDNVVNQVNGYKADLSYTQALIDKTVVKAPFGGVLGLRQVSPGAYVTPTNIIATLQQVDRIKIDFTIPEEYGSYIRKGATVDIEFDAVKNSRRKAQILATEPQVNQTTRNLKVRAVLPAGTGNPGAFVKVYVESGLDKKAIMVPTNAIIPDDKNKQLILVKDGKANFANVETGVRESDDVEIVSGVNVGDTIVVTGVLFARPKSQLKIRSVKKLAN